MTDKERIAVPSKPKIEWRIDTIKGTIALMLPRSGLNGVFDHIHFAGYMDLQFLATELHDRICPEVDEALDKLEKEQK